ncbi:MAG: DUF2336 domain-containing protein [Rhodospirillaceae bacterium]|nr:DUF2336 domain-containing protein [Rhodospirillaceae bacterium]
MAKIPLTPADVERLLANPSPESRAEAATRVGESYGADLGDAERGIAEEIFRIMVKDAEARVRQALSESLKDNPAIPHDLALSLAEDVAEVALPVIEFSDVLTDSDLLDIIASNDETKQVAVASRPMVSETISSALVDTENEAVVSTLVANDGAEISRESFDKVIDTLGASEKVQTALVRRTKVPVAIAERLLSVVSDNLRDELAARHEMPGGMADYLVLHSRERATVALSQDSSAEDVGVLVRQLHGADRLTPSIILRALCVGDMRFFEAALSTMADVPLVSARKLIYDPGELGLHRIYSAAGLPEPQFVAARAAVRVVQELEYDGIENSAEDRERFARRMIEMILTQYDELGVEFESDDLDYLITKIDGLPPDHIEVLDPGLGNGPGGSS